MATQLPVKCLMMHVYVSDKRVYSGVVDRTRPASEWIPRIISAASHSVGKDIKTKQTHPNDLLWISSDSNADNLKIDAIF